MFQLRVKLLTPLCCGSGFGRSGYVDRDVVFDDAGLPYLPGRRLKGLLRDGYRQVYQVLKLPNPGLIFGEPGDETPGAITVGNAILSHGDRIRSWLLQVFHESKHTLRRDDVIGYYTEIRRQTAIDRHTGAADENTLRATRVLRSGLEFLADLEIDTKYEAALESAAKAVQLMGTSRTRGLGSVQCSIMSNAMEPVPIPGEGADDQDVQTSPDHSMNAASGRWRSEPDSLAFSLLLEQSALFPSLAGDANTVLTYPFVPGAAIRGLFARLYMKQYGVDSRFSELFCSGRVGFLPANLEIVDSNAERRRTLPVPNSVRVEKSDDRFFHDLAGDEKPSDEPIRRVPGWTLHRELFEGQDAAQAEVRTELQYHHQRAHNGAIGKAVGAEQIARYEISKEEAGALFTYEAMSAGQRFLGEILGEPNDLRAIRALIADSRSTVQLGRSRSAQYGGRALWTWEDVTVEERPPVDPTKSLVVTLLTPLLALSEDGHPQPRFPKEDFEHELNVSLTPQKAFVRTHWQGGYLAHQRLPRQQVPALAPGSVFVFSVKSIPPDGAIERATRRSYGLRTEDGFGKISLSNPTSAVSLARYTPPALSMSPKVQPGSEEYKIATGILEIHFRGRVREEALKLAKMPDEEKLRRLTPHVIHRLIWLAETDRLLELTKASERFSRTLRNWTVSKGTLSNDTSLLDFLMEDWKKIYAELHSVSPTRGKKTDWLKIVGDPFQGAEKSEEHEHYTFARALVKYFRLRYLAALTWRKQGIARRKPKASAGA